MSDTSNPKPPVEARESTPEWRTESFARTLAHVRHFGSAHEAEVLSRLGVEAQYRSWAAAVPTALAKEQPPRPLQKIFSDTFMRVRADLKRDAPALDSIKPLIASSPSPLPSSLDDTLPIRPATRAKSALPFQSGRAAAPPVAPPVEWGGPPSAGSGTLPLQEGRAVAPHLASWNLTQYAQFTADRRRFDPIAVRRNYGVKDTEEELALMAHFNKLFASNPALREEWLALLDRALNQQGR